MLDDLANALGCAVADLTRQPDLPPDRATADAMTMVPGIEFAIHDCTLGDVPDIPTRPIAELVKLAQRANAHCDETRYAVAGQDFGAVLRELHVHAATGDSETHRAALAALVEHALQRRAPHERWVTVPWRSLSHGAVMTPPSYSMFRR